MPKLNINVLDLRAGFTSSLMEYGNHLSFELRLSRAARFFINAVLKDLN
jgi:hypothetical protein